MKIDRWRSCRALRTSLLIGLFACQGSGAGSSIKSASDFLAPPKEKGGEVSPDLPHDPSVVSGQLPNGMSYSVRRSALAKGRAHFVLAVRAGSVLEEENERGIAHFVERLAFRGTGRFSEKALHQFMSDSGLESGADNNATTLYDSTLFRLSAPSGDPVLLGRALDILDDWATRISFEPAVVEAERALLLAELEERADEKKRVAPRRTRLLLKGSRYRDREIHGLAATIAAVTPAQLKAFYRRWYRPEHMAIVVVGDMETAAAQSAIEDRFLAFSTEPNAPERPPYSVPVQGGTHISLLADEKHEENQAQIVVKLPPTSFATEGDYRRRLSRQLIVQMLGQRLRRAAKDPASSYKSAVVVLQPGFLEAFDLVQIVTKIDEGQAYNALHDLLFELRRVKLHGFLQTELERTSARILKRLDVEVAVESRASSEALAMELAQSFLTGDAVMGPDHERAVGERLLATITLQEVNAESQRWVKEAERYVLAVGPEIESLPGRDSLLGAINEVERAQIEPYRDLAADGQLMPTLPTAGSIVGERYLEGVDVHEWSLSNGAKVIFKPSTSQRGKVISQSVSSGGTSTVSDQGFLTARFAQQLVNVGGVGEYDVSELSKMLTGKELLVSPWISEYQEGIRASAAAQDFETMLQLLHLFMTAPRKDVHAFDGFRRQLFDSLAGRSSTPSMVLSDTIAKRSWQPWLRHVPAAPESVQNIDLDSAFDFYRNRFGNAADFTFVFVGDIPLERMRSMTERYLASLPAVPRDDVWVDRQARRKPGIVKVRVRGARQPKSQVGLLFHGEAPWTAQSEVELMGLKGVLELRIREVLTKQLGGLYGARVWTRMDRVPYQHYVLGIDFECRPQDAAALRDSALAVVKELQQTGVGLPYVERIKAQRDQNYRAALGDNRYWLEGLVNAYRFGEDPGSLLTATDRTGSITSEGLKAAARRYLRLDQYVDSLLFPDTPASEPKPTPAVSAPNP